MKIPVHYYEKVMPDTPIGEVQQAAADGVLHNEGGTLYIVSII